MNKKIILALLAVSLGVLAVGGYFFYQKSLIKSLGSVTYGYQIWPGVLPYLVAYEKGFFTEQGLEIKLVKKDSYIETVDDLVAGKLDFAGAIALIDVVEKVSQGNDLKVVMATDYSNGADGIVAKQEIKAVSDLKGKTVAVEKGTLGEYLLYDALMKNNLTLADVIEVNLTTQESAQAFIRGEVDAAVTYEPDFSQAVSQGNGWRIYTSANSPGLIIDVLAWRSDYAAQNPAKVRAVVSAYLKAVDFINQNPDRAIEIGAKYFAISPSELKDQLKGIKQMGLNDNLIIMPYGSGSDSLHGLIRQSSDFLIAKGTIAQPVDSVAIIDPQYLRQQAVR